MKINISEIVRSSLWIVIALLPLLFVSSLFFLKDPPVWPDEPIFFEMAKNMSETGKAITTLYSGTDSDIGQTGLGYPPLYFKLLGVWISAFGETIEVMRGFSLLIALASLSLFFFVIREVFQKKSFAVLGVILLSLNIYFSRASRLGRMEILALFFILLSSLFFLQFLKNHKRSSFIFAGFASAMAILSHPMGLMSALILGLCVLFRISPVKEKLVLLALLALPLALAGLIWVFSSGVSVDSIISTYLAHWQDKSPKIPYVFTLFNTDFSWRLFFATQIVIFLIFIILFQKFPLKGRLFVLVGTIITALLTIMGKENGYQLYLQPFIILEAIYIIDYLKSKEGELMALGYIGIILVTFYTSLNIQFLNNDNLAITNPVSRSFAGSLNSDYHKYTSQIFSSLPQDKPTNLFIAAVPDPYFGLSKRGNFRMYEAPDPYFPISDTEYRKTLDSVDYLVLTWIPHKFLADYIKKNTLEELLIGGPGQYRVLIIKLKPKNERN